MSSKNDFIKDMLGGNLTKRPQVGYEPTRVQREIGEKWTDSDGDQWEQMNGYISKIPKAPSVGIADTCSDCEKLVLKKWDKDTYNRFNRCYHCQVNFELDLKFMKIANGNKWQHWVRLQQLKRMDSVEEDLKQFIFNRHDENESKIFDSSVANAIANDNIRQTMNKNKNT